jgi:uncharacterized membrane protein YfcA
MIAVLVVIGLVVGAISGFFGVGGGMILVPTLLSIGIDIKSAIAISVVQMVFSSILGSYLNYKKGKLEVTQGIWVGVGGILGGILGAQFTDILPNEVLEYSLFALVTFALIRVATSKKPSSKQQKGEFSKAVLFFIGFAIGVVAIMLGVGGSIMLTPILVGFLHFSTKEAAVAGLFFVVFSSISGLFYKIINGTFENLSLDFTLALSVAIASLIGVVVGIKLKDIIRDTHHKTSLIVMYIIILVLLAKKIFLG